MNATNDSTRITHSVNQSQEILSHYLNLALQAADVRIDADVREEIRGILTYPFEELLKRIDQLEQRIKVLENVRENTPEQTCCHCGHALDADGMCPIPHNLYSATIHSDEVSND